MRLHLPVYVGTQLLLPAGKVLNSADVDFLRRRCSGKAVSVEDPVLDELIAFQDDSDGFEIAHRMQRQLISLMGNVQGMYGSRLTAGAVDCAGIKQAVTGVLGHMSERPSMAAALIGMRGLNEYLATHAAHVFYLSLMMGNAVRSRVAAARRAGRNRLGYQTSEALDLTPLALASLFMDVGLLEIKEVFTQAEPLTLKQCQVIRDHPVAGGEAIGSAGPAPTRLIIETHHENYDGSGYPYALKGDEIHVLARILRIADAYSAATSQRAFAEACSPVRALWEITWGSHSQFYDPVLLKIFASLIQPYPIGARVGLNSGFEGVVVRYGEHSPFMPEVVIAYDSKGERLPKSDLKGPFKLDAHPSLKIVSFDGEDLTDLYSHDIVIPEVTPAEFTTLYESMYTGCAVPAP